MKQVILNRLRSCGPMRSDQLLGSLSEHYATEEALLRDLRALRREGRILKSNALRPKWKWDEDFVCEICERGFPEVRRDSTRSCCSPCRRGVRLKGKTASGVNAYTKTRYAPDDVGPNYPARAMQELMRRRWA